MNSADLHVEIGTIMPKIVELLSNYYWGVRQTGVNTLSKFVDHGETSLLCYAILLIINLANLHTEIGTTVPKIIKLLSDDD